MSFLKHKLTLSSYPRPLPNSLTYEPVLFDTIPISPKFSEVRFVCKINLPDSILPNFSTYSWCRGLSRSYRVPGHWFFNIWVTFYSSYALCLLSIYLYIGTKVALPLVIVNIQNNLFINCCLYIIPSYLY